MNTKTYDIYLVPNGNTRDFARGMTNGCEQWGNDMTLDEVRQRYLKLADENFRSDGGEYDRIWGKCAAEHPEQSDEGYSEPEFACVKYLDELIKDPDPLNWERIDWNNDLKWVTICEHKE